MISVDLTQEEFERVQTAVLDYAFLGYKDTGDRFKEDSEDLRNSILKKFGLTGDDSNSISWHSDGCKCFGCSQVRKERAQLRAYYGDPYEKSPNTIL